MSCKSPWLQYGLSHVGKQSQGTSMLDLIDFTPPETHVAFVAIGQSDVGKAFTEDCQLIAAECAEFAKAPAEWQPDTAGKLLDAQTGRARWLAGQVFLTAWATGLSRESAAEFASVISYLAGDTVLREHLNAGNTDRDYVEFMVEMFEVDLAAAFENLMANAAYETPRTTH
jgi:hypothetical protein